MVFYNVRPNSDSYKTVMPKYGDYLGRYASALNERLVKNQSDNLLMPKSTSVMLNSTKTPLIPKFQLSC